MARPVVMRSIKRARLSALDSATDVAGQLSPTAFQMIERAGDSKPQHVSRVAAPRKKKARSKRSRK